MKFVFKDGHVEEHKLPLYLYPNLPAYYELTEKPNKLIFGPLEDPTIPVSCKKITFKLVEFVNKYRESYFRYEEI